MAGKQSLFGPVDPPPTRGTTRATPHARASSPTPASASAARRARWPARSGTTLPADHFEMLGSSYDNSSSLNANQWRHVAFIEQPKRLGGQESGCPPGGRGGRLPGDAVDGGAPGRPESRRGPGRRRRGAAARVRRGRRRGPARLPLADVVGRLQALHARRLPRRLSHRVAVPLGVRDGGRPGRHLQRLRVLRPGLSLRRDRAASGARGVHQRRHRPEVHVVLRPPRRGQDTRVRAGLPHSVHPVR